MRSAPETNASASNFSGAARNAARLVTPSSCCSYHCRQLRLSQPRRASAAAPPHLAHLGDARLVARHRRVTRLAARQRLR
jgi:hypothetical protein